ncbi:MAG: hypothetical protein JXA42_13655 [Anaerolineales bacterium]|nr:hypothetical protein [Anaerolineales bacterium]
MIRIPLRDLENVRNDPIAYRKSIQTRNSYWFPKSYFNALRDTINNYHGTKDNFSSALGYLENRLENFKNQRKCVEILEQFYWYVAEYTDRKSLSFYSRLNIQVPLSGPISSETICSGQISRVDIVPDGGYAAWLFRSRNYEDWFNELRMPLIQGTLATTILNVPLNEVKIGIYSFDERFVESRCYTNEEIGNAFHVLYSLLEQVVYVNEGNQ